MLTWRRPSSKQQSINGDNADRANGVSLEVGGWGAVLSGVTVERAQQKGGRRLANGALKDKRGWPAVSTKPRETQITTQSSLSRSLCVVI